MYKTQSVSPTCVPPIYVSLAIKLICYFSHVEALVLAVPFQFHIMSRKSMYFKTVKACVFTVAMVTENVN